MGQGKSSRVYSNDDELNLYENEELEVIADGEGDGWVKVSHQESIAMMMN